MDKISLQRDDSTQVEVHLHGATVTSWKCKGEEMLFVSKKSIFDGKKAIRGGIPVVFPNFGPWELGPQHGFARISTWSVQQEPVKDDHGDVAAILLLKDNENTRKMWNHRFQLLYKLTLGDGKFHMSLTVTNQGEEQFDFTTLLHTYFRVPDVTQTTVSGLGGISYIDKIENSEIFTEEHDPISVNCLTDRVYINALEEHNITNAAGGRDVKVTKTNLPDTVVWNPWEDKAKGMADFADDEYPNMLCVEAGFVNSRFTLLPGQSFQGAQTLTCAC